MSEKKVTWRIQQRYKDKWISVGENYDSDVPANQVLSLLKERAKEDGRDPKMYRIIQIAREVEE